MFLIIHYKFIPWLRWKSHSASGYESSRFMSEEKNVEKDVSYRLRLSEYLNGTIGESFERYSSTRVYYV